MHTRLGISLMLTLFVMGISALSVIGQDTASVIVNTAELNFQQSPPALVFAAESDGIGVVNINGEKVAIEFRRGSGLYRLQPTQKGELFIVRTDKDLAIYHVAKRQGNIRFKKIPLWLSILPPLVAIFLALVFREVLISLFAGVWMGAFIAGGLRFDSPYYVFAAFLESIQTYIINALADSGHLAVIVFSLLIGAMVAIISKNGGMAGVVHKLSRYATSPRRSQAVTWLLGVAIFFDDYANTLIVGNTMRSITDKFNVSREKLAYIVDSTAAPVAAVAFITTWIGAELGYIDSGIVGIESFPFDMTPYAIFIGSLKYSFYPVLTLIFILMLIYQRKDYGPMLKAERRAHRTGQVSPALTAQQDEPNMEDLSPVKGAPLRWYNAFIPVSLVIIMTIFGLIQTGVDATYLELLDAGIDINYSSFGEVWSRIGLLTPEGDSGFLMKVGKLIGNADSYTALLWASLTGVVAAIVLTIGQKIISLFDTMHYFTIGVKTMMPAILILTLAWALAITTQELHTADYLTSLLSESVSPFLMPGIIFILAAVIAFSTGSSWSTMAILYPIAIPTTWAICMAQGIDPEHSLELLLNVIATVLAASVLGDHCSPISDTTILSSLASDCNHIDHVRTQLPYALTVGSVSLVMGSLSSYFGGGWGICLIFGAVSLLILYVVINRVGTNPYQT